VSVDVNRDVGELLAEGLDQHGGCLGLEDTGHVLNAEDVGSRCQEKSKEEPGLDLMNRKERKKKENIPLTRAWARVR